MGKFFAVVLVIITLVSAYFVVAHTWWMPIDVSVHGPAVDHQLEETMLGSGILFVLSQLVLAAFVFMFGDSKGARKMKKFPGGATPLVIAAIVLVGIEILTLSFVGSKVWASIYFTPPDPNSLHGGCAGGAVRVLFPLCRAGWEIRRSSSGQDR